MASMNKYSFIILPMNGLVDADILINSQFVVVSNPCSVYIF